MTDASVEKARAQKRGWAWGKARSGREAGRYVIDCKPSEREEHSFVKDEHILKILQSITGGMVCSITCWVVDDIKGGMYKTFSGENATNPQNLIDNQEFCVSDGIFTRHIPIRSIVSIAIKTGA